MSKKMLEGKVALVTGAGRGIGRAIALVMAENGAQVVVNDIGAAVDGSGNDSTPAQQVVSEIEALHGQGQAVANYDSVADWDSAQSMVQTAIDRFGKIDIVVNNAGILRDTIFHRMTPEEFDAVVKVHLYGAFYVSRAALPHLKSAREGRIVNLGCASAQHVLARSTNTPYVIAKTGVIIYTKSLATQLIRDHITANVICPGIAENSFDLAESLPELPTGRPATTRDITAAAWFFISPGAGYITGQVLEVAGGWRL